MTEAAPRKASSDDCTVAFQGEPGAYSEAAILELLGRKSVQPVPFASFDDAFAACSSRQVDLLMVPIENSLGGTIHANCDLQLQHSLFIIAEHNFRVRHSLVALPGTKLESLTKIMSHPQALAQCDTWLKAQGIKGEAAYDTAGSAKLISEGKLENVGAICSELACQYYGMELLEKGLEDDSHNYTRFLLLRTDPVQVPRGVKCKTSIVFSLANQTGSLFKALSCFSLRDIDLSKIESRPCKPDIMDRLERLYQSMNANQQWSGHLTVMKPGGSKPSGAADATFRYLFYLDCVASVEETNAANALAHLREISTFVRVLGSFPVGGTYVELDNLRPNSAAVARKRAKRTQRVGIVGFGTFGAFIGKRLATDFEVFATSRSDYSALAAESGVEWCKDIDELLQARIDILIISVSILSFEAQVRSISDSIKRLGIESNSMLVVDVLSVKTHAKTTMLALLPDSCDILCTHPMFGPQSGKDSWAGLPFVFERVRLLQAPLCEGFLKWWGDQGCRMVDMSCELHDECAASSQFITHFTGRVLARLGLKTTPINTKGYDSLLHLTENTCKDSFDLFYALYKCNPNSEGQLQAFQGAIAEVSAALQKGLGEAAPPARQVSGASGYGPA